MNIAHRGDNERGKYAEHSFAAYDRAVCAQVDYLELDLQESADHVLVVSHDNNLSRVFGVDQSIEKNTFKKKAFIHSKRFFNAIKITRKWSLC